MNDFELSPLAYLMQGLWGAAVLAGPPLLSAIIVGVIIALVQTLIQLQEQTLPMGVKIITVGSILMMFGYTLSSPLYVSAENIFINFPVIAK